MTKVDNALSEHIREYGYGVMRGFVDDEELESLDRLCESLKVPHRSTGYDGREITTYRVPDLLVQTRDLDSLVTDPRLLSTFSSIVSTTEDWGLNLSDMSIKYLVPGQDVRSLHRDDDVYPFLSRSGSFTANALLALDRFDEEVGATTIVPGSHTWAHPVDQDQPRIAVEMDPGDLLILAGRTWHGHGQNRTSDRIRRAFNFYVCAGWLQSGYAARFGLSDEQVSALPDAMQQLLSRGARGW